MKASHAPPASPVAEQPRTARGVYVDDGYTVAIACIVYSNYFMFLSIFQQITFPAFSVVVSQQPKVVFNSVLLDIEHILLILYTMLGPIIVIIIYICICIVYINFEFFSYNFVHRDTLVIFVIHTMKKNEARKHFFNTAVN